MTVLLLILYIYEPSELYPLTRTAPKNRELPIIS